MIKKATLTALPFTLFDDLSPFYLTENESLIFIFKCETYNLDEAFLRLKINKTEKVYSLREQPIAISRDDELLQTGRLDCEVFIPNLKKWSIDGFFVKTFDDSIMLTSFIDTLSTQYAELEERIKKIENKINVSL